MSDGVFLQLKRDEHIREWHNAREAVAAARDVEPDELSRPDVVESLLETHELARLRKDMRVTEARQVVADDHGMDADEISLAALLKVTAGAYCGYQQTSDWQVAGDD